MPAIDPFDVAAHEKAVNESAGRASALWVSFLVFVTYIALAVGSVSHEDLFRESPIKLPVLGVDLNLVAFFVVAPVLFLVYHAYVLIQLVLLARTVEAYNVALRETVNHKPDRTLIRERLTNFLFVQLVGGAQDERTGRMSRLLRLIAAATMIVGPIAVLLLVQIAFLPYHHAGVTWAHRLVLLADLAVIWVLWPSVLGSAKGDLAIDQPSKRPRTAAAMGVVGLFAILIATFPGEVLDANAVATAKWVPWYETEGKAIKWRRESLYALLLSGEANRVTGQPKSLFSNVLVLPDRDFVDDKVLAEIEKRENEAKTDLRKGERTIRLRGRDLVGAVLDRADLRRADLTGARLDNASLIGAELAGAWFLCGDIEKPDSCASLRYATFNFAQLQGAILDRAWLQGATLDRAQLQGATLDRAQLQGASLLGAQLQGATLDRAELQGASLLGAQLRGARLAFAQLQGATLDRAELQGATLVGAQLQGATLFDAQLQGATLDFAQLQGATLNDAQLQGSSLLGSMVWRASFDGAACPDMRTRGVLTAQLYAWRTAAVEARDVATLIADAMQDAPNDKVRRRIEGRLAVLKPGARTETQDREMVDFWDEIEKCSASEDEYRDRLAKVLLSLACDDENAPYVARGLILHGRLADTGPHLFSLAEALRDPRTCPGAKGLTDTDHAALDELVAEVRVKFPPSPSPDQRRQQPAEPAPAQR